MGVLQSINSIFFLEDFVIDEQPVEVYQNGDSKTSEETLGSSAETGEQENDHKPAEKDILTVISQLMGDHEKLIGINEELEKRTPQGEDMEKFIKKFLPTLDSFERILFLGREFSENEVVDNWLKSIETIYFRLKNLFEKYGLMELKCIGKTVDFDLHDVVEVCHSDDHPEGVIMAERQKGYILNGRLLREAKVVVSTRE